MKEKVLVLREKGNLRVEKIDLNNLHSKSIIKKENNFKIF